MIRLCDKSIKVLLVSPNSTARQMMGSVLKESGYQNITGIADLETSIGILETEDIGWIISPVLHEDNVNILQILKIIIKNPLMQRIKISLIIGQNEEYFLPKAYEMGILSHHVDCLSKDKFGAEIKDLFACLEANQGDYCLAAATYLRKFLKDQKRFKDLVGFESGLYRNYLGNTQRLIDLANAYILLDEKDKGKLILQQALFMDQNVSDQIDHIIREHFPGEDMAQIRTIGDGTNLLELESAVIVDAKEEYSNKLSEILGSLGVGNINCFKDPKEAWNYINSEPQCSIIFSEWALPSMPAPVFLQRAKDKVGLDVPIVIISDEVAAGDIQFLHEIGIFRCISKNLAEADLIKEIITLAKESKYPTLPSAILRKVKIGLAKKDLKAVEKYRRQFFDSDQVREADKKTLEAEIALKTGCVNRAKDLAMAALKLAGDPIWILNILGNALMKLREFEAAIRCLENAQVISPFNVDRLCRIAEANLELGDNKEVEETIDKAKKIDSDSEKIKATETKVALQGGDTKRAKELMEDLSSFSDIISFTNNRGVALIQVGKIDDGIKLYHEALEALPPNKQEISSVVNYNLSLAYVKSNKLDQAAITLEKALECNNEMRVKKIKHLRKRVKTALKDGVPIQLKFDSISKEDEEKKLDELNKLSQDIAETISVTRQDSCCYKVFKTTEKIAEIDKMIAQIPKFKPRTSIKRDEGAGVEKEIISA